MSKQARLKKVENLSQRFSSLEARTKKTEEKIDLLEGTIQYMNGETGKKAAENRHMSEGKLRAYANTLGVKKIKK